MQLNVFQIVETRYRISSLVDRLEYVYSSMGAIDRR